MGVFLGGRREEVEELVGRGAAIIDFGSVEFGGVCTYSRAKDQAGSNLVVSTYQLAACIEVRMADKDTHDPGFVGLGRRGM